MQVLRGFSVFVLFLLISLVMTWPLCLHMGSHITTPPKDNLLISWILSWEMHSLGSGIPPPASGSPVHSPCADSFWSANIFYPSARTLSYTEHFLGFLPFAFILQRLTGNILTVLNSLIILSFAISGLGMYLLAYRLTRNVPASIISATAFAFAPYKMSHLMHLHILATHFIPFILLFWHKSMKDRRFSDFLLFAIFTWLEGLSCLQYCLFMLTLLPVITIVTLARERRLFRGAERYYWLAAHGVILLMFVPVFLPYYQTLRRLGVITTTFPSWSADLLSFFLTGADNHLWGWLTRLLGRGQDPESYLFPGVLLAVLAIMGIRSFVTGRVKSGEKKGESVSAEGESGRAEDESAPPKRPLLLRFAEIAAALSALLVLLIVLTGGFTRQLGPLYVSVTTISIPSTLFLLCLVLRLLLDRPLVKLVAAALRTMPVEPLVYLIFVASGIIFSFYAPFVILGRLLPPLSSVQVSARFFSIALFGLSMFAGWGYLELAKIKAFSRIAPILIPVLMLAEAFSAPIHLAPVLENSAPPAVYGKVAGLPRDAVLLELPMAKDEDNALAMFYSTWHWKKLVNGYSGINPRYFRCLIDIFNGFPSDEALQTLALFDVDYVLIHNDRLEPGRRQEIEARIGAFPALQAVERSPAISLYRVSRTGVNATVTAITRVTAYPIDRKGWKINAEPNPGFMEDQKNLLDGVLRSYWTSGRLAKKGDSIWIDLGREVAVSGVGFFQGTDFAFYLRDFTIEVSRDGKSWSRAASRRNEPPPFESYFENPGNPSIFIPITGQMARYLRITADSDSLYKWTFHELKVYSPDETSGKKELLIVN